MIKRKGVFILLIIFLITYCSLASISIKTTEIKENKIFNINSDFYSVKIILNKGKLIREIISDSKGANKLKTDGNFKINLMWTGWQAPGVLNNSENPVDYDSSDFEFTDYSDNDKTLKLNFKGKGRLNLKLTLIYQFPEGKYYFRRKVEISRLKKGAHFLRKIYPINYSIKGNNLKIIKKGGYGQPVGFLINDGGYFFGLEYPSSYNSIKNNILKCWQYIGEKIEDIPVSSDWTIIGITPDKDIKKWFFRYLNDIRVAKLRPFVLYNSWYDLEAPEMVENEKNIMNEKNTLRIYNLFKKIMMNKYKVKLDAFVLDDGWDIYKSDWKLSDKQFPNGLKPIADRLKKDGVSLGIWFGPIGGYSHRSWRLEWMKEHGYETIGTQLCFGGRKYNELFKKRVEDFVKNDGVGYYKWDGFQFSCSEKNHGHPIGIYSRRYILNKLIEVSNSVRKLNPDIFLNITSGTWLSPWWLKIADQIWMQGYDYGYAGVPSISKRDMAMTYRDYVLYDDFKNNDMWFPIANLMTHGIIKGDLQKLGGEKEPIDKFTNNSVLYFARGVSMYELYITPDLLSENEWKAIMDSIKWAKENFEILSNNTNMIGGNPGKKESYGYIHFKNTIGIIAVRNPYIETGEIEFELKTEYGVKKTAKNLVLEKIYPKRWISPVLYKEGDKVNIKLKPYETAVYKIYPISETNRVLLANIIYTKKRLNNKQEILFLYKSTGKPKILNIGKLKYIKESGKKIGRFTLNVPEKKEQNNLKNVEIVRNNGKTILNLTIDKDFIKPELAVLLTSFMKEKKEEFPAEIMFRVNGKIVKSSIIKNLGWGWFRTMLANGKNNIVLTVKKPSNWKGNMKIYFKYNSRIRPRIITVNSKQKIKPEKLLPFPYSGSLFRKTDKIGEYEIK
jgi:hypothetical protein